LISSKINIIEFKNIISKLKLKKSPITQNHQSFFKEKCKLSLKKYFKNLQIYFFEISIKLQAQRKYLSYGIIKN